MTRQAHAVVLFGTFPCGCIIDTDVVIEHSGAIICCPWCEATFNAFDFGEWLRERDNNVTPPVMVIAPTPRTVLKFGNHLLEALQACVCERGTVVRELGCRRLIPFCLSVPIEAVEVLRN